MSAQQRAEDLADDGFANSLRTAEAQSSAHLYVNLLHNLGEPSLVPLVVILIPAGDVVLEVT
jgi:hypothetical protein